MVKAKQLGKTMLVAIFIIVMAVIVITISALVLWEAMNDKAAATWSNVAIGISLVAMSAFYFALPVVLGLAGTKLAFFYILSFMSMLLIGICVLGVVMDKQSPNNDNIALSAQITSGFAIAISAVALIYSPIYIRRSFKNQTVGD